MSKELLDIEDLGAPAEAEGLLLKLLRHKLLKQYIPRRPRSGQTVEVTYEEFQQSGCELLAIGRIAAITLGWLTEWGWRHLRERAKMDDKPITTEGRWSAFCAKAWGCSRPTVVKAWVVAKAQIDGLDVPEDTPGTLVWEIHSGTSGDVDQSARVLDKALVEGWTSWDVRKIKALHRAGLLPEHVWERPTFRLTGNTLMFSINGREDQVAQFQDGDLLKAALLVLEMDTRLELEEEE